MPIRSYAVSNLREYIGNAEKGEAFTPEEFSARIREVTKIDIPAEMISRLENEEGASDMTVVQMDALMDFANETGFCDIANEDLYRRPWEGSGRLAGFGDGSPVSWKYHEGVKVSRKHNPKKSLEGIA